MVESPHHPPGSKRVLTIAPRRSTIQGSMLTVLSVLAGLSLVSLWAVSWLFLSRIDRIESRTKAELAEALRAILEPSAEGQPSALAIYSDQVATLFAARIVQQLKTAAGGVASGVSKEAEAGALGQLAGGSPWLALLSGLLPKRFRNQLLSAPQFTGQLRLPEGNGSEPQTASVADRLKRHA